MYVAEVKVAIRQLTALYFSVANVTYTKQSFTAKPTKPLVTLTSGTVSRPRNPPVKIIDGRPVSFYPATMPIQIDLFTHGRKKVLKRGQTPIMENTAEDDMLSFADFLNSDFVIQWCHERDLSIIVPNTVEDLTGLINDTNYEYRAMMEVQIGFTMTAIGYTGVMSPESIKHSGVTVDPETGEQTPYEYTGGDIQGEDVTAMEPVAAQTPSGGGNAELAEQEGGYFTNVEINNSPVKKEEQPHER